MKLFEYAVIYHPAQTKEDREAGRSKKSELVVDVKRVLAADEKAAMIMAARDIPAEHTEHLDKLEIAIRPF